MHEDEGVERSLDQETHTNPHQSPVDLLAMEVLGVHDALDRVARASKERVAVRGLQIAQEHPKCDECEHVFPSARVTTR